MQSIIIDWLEFTILQASALDWAFAFLCVDSANFEDLTKGGLGYKRQLYYNNIRIYFDGNEGMGTHIQISGKGCRYLESQGKNLYKMLYTLHDMDNINLTRLDLALDTTDNILSKMLDSISNNLFSSRSQSIRVISSYTNSYLQADTLYIGSRSSLLMVRVYNKALEQGLDADWYRIEIVFKKERIRLAVPFLRQGVPHAFAGILNNYFRPLECLKSQKCRSPTADYWVDFLGSVAKISIFEQPQAPSIEDKYAWIVSQVEPTIAMLSLAFGNSQWLSALAERGKDRLREKDYKLIQNWRNQ